MANYFRREKTLTYIEFVVPTPTNWAENAKAESAAAKEWRKIHPNHIGTPADDSVEVLSTEEAIIYRIAKEDIVDAYKRPIGHLPINDNEEVDEADRPLCST